MSHGDQTSKAKLVEAIRALEKELRPPDDDPRSTCRGRSCASAASRAARPSSRQGQRFILDRDNALGDSKRVELPHPELFAAIGPGDRLLIDDGKVRLRVLEVGGRPASSTEVQVGGTRLEQQGRQRPRRRRADPGADRQGPADLQFALEQGADWIALVLRPAARGRRRGARADRRQGGADRQDREAGGDRPARRDHRACRRR